MSNLDEVATTPAGLSNRSTQTKLKPSETSNVSTVDDDSKSGEHEALCCLFPHCGGKPVYGGNPEALGFAVDTAGRSITLANGGAFFATAILRLATEAAGCETDPPEGSNVVPECQNRVYGLRPSSYIVLYTVVIGVVTAALMPLIGSLVDYSEKRLTAGRCTAVTFVTFLFPPIFLSSESWFPVTLLMYMAAFSGWTLTTLTYSYLPDVADSPQQLNVYTKSFTVLTFGAMVAMILTVILASTLLGFGDDAVMVARFSSAITVMITGSLLYCSWFQLFRPRPPLRKMPSGQTIWNAGFIQVYNTSLRIYREMPALKWFYLSILFIEAGTNSLGSIAITYFTSKLGFSSQENGIFVLVTLMGSIPGGILSAWANTRWNPIISSILSTIVLMVFIVLAAVFLTGPGQEYRAYLISAGFGLGAGAKWTVDRLLASVLIPRGQDTELMGTFLFAGQVFTWVPPLIFAAMNEAGIDQRIGIATLPIYLIIGIFCLYSMGDYKAALIASGRDEMLPQPAAVRQGDDTSSFPRHGDGTSSSRPLSPVLATAVSVEI
jgi:MFS-type transporter involved in bile tolerance (Atg22 family)